VDVVLCIDVDDIERGIDFYTRALGLRLGRRFAPDWVELLGAPAPIFLQRFAAGSVPSPGTTARRDYGRHWTPVHLDFVVPDVRAAVERARAAGGALEREIQVRPWNSLACMADPFGNGFDLIELHGRGWDEIAPPA
jgi:catechol 2,3-dioxygenase-like lactoylglutathione lyase family enzyme